MATATRSRKDSRSTPRARVRSRFNQWLGVRDQGEILKDRQDELRVELLTDIERLGKKDAEGHFWLQLDQPVEFKDRKGKTKIFDRLKSQLSLRPANPAPDPELAEELLKRKKLWITQAQLDALDALRIQLPLFTISVDLDTDAVADLVFRGKITDKEYESILQEQTEVISFIPVES